jgi:hypothetical protein
MLGFHTGIKWLTLSSGTQGRSELGESDAKEIEKLSLSPSFLGLADSILKSFDRDTLAEFLAGYLYFRSKGRTNSDFAFFMVTKKFGKTATVAMSIVVALIPGLLFDKAFRSVTLAAAMKIVGERKKPPKSATSKVD